MNKRTSALATVFLFACFAIYTVLTKTVDVGDRLSGTKLGFSTINRFFQERYSYNAGYVNIAQYLGFAALGVALSFVLLGISQLISSKSFTAVAPCLYVLGGFYTIVFVCYMLFDRIAVNYSPVSIEGVLKPSYPAIPSVVGICIFVSASIMFESLSWKAEGLKNAIKVFSAFLAIVLLIATMSSGMYWFTDVVGCVLLSLALLALFITAKNFVTEKL